MAQVQRTVADDALLARAGDLAEEQALGGYDAVHLASAEAVGGADTVVLTADGKLRDAASRLGLAVADFPT